MSTIKWGRLAVASLTVGLFLLSYGVALAAPYTPVASPVAPAGGVALPPPSVVPGKEWSEGGPLGVGPDRDAAGVPDSQQNVAWDGSGGVTDGIDYTGLGPWFGDDVDALANGFDSLYPEVIVDTANLLFSVGNGTTLLGSGFVGTSGGNVIGGAGDINFEAPGIAFQSVWATGSLDVDVTTPPVDVDGLEIWGPEPPVFDSDKFSLFGDAGPAGGGPKVSIWDLPSASPYLLHMDVVSSISLLLGLPADADPQEVDIDALMVFDAGDDSSFGELGDSLIFSVRQLPDMVDPTGFYATGSEIFKLDFDGVGPIGAGITPSFLVHGGHAWDKAYALSAMVDAGTGFQLDLNALEAASIPEPSRAMLVMLGVAGVLLRRRK